MRHDAKYLKVAAGEHIVVEEGKAKRASLSQIKTGRTTKEGLTISTGAELKTGKGVKEVPKSEGCCAVELGITLALKRDLTKGIWQPTSPT